MREATDRDETTTDESATVESEPSERKGSMLERLSESMKDWVDHYPAHQRMFPDQ